MHYRWTLVIAIVSTLSAGCLQEPDSVDMDSTCETPPCESGDDSADRSQYPGSYGTTAESILAPLTFKSIDGSDYSLESVFKDATNQVML